MLQELEAQASLASQHTILLTATSSPGLETALLWGRVQTGLHFGFIVMIRSNQIGFWTLGT